MSGNRPLAWATACGVVDEPLGGKVIPTRKMEFEAPQAREARPARAYFFRRREAVAEGKAAPQPSLITPPKFHVMAWSLQILPGGEIVGGTKV